GKRAYSLSVARAWQPPAAEPGARAVAARVVDRAARSAPFEPVADTRVNFLGLRRQQVAEILDLIKRTDLDLARPGHGNGAALHPGDGFVHVLDLPEPVAGNQLAGRGEGPVDHRAARPVEPDALAGAGRLEAVAREQDAGLDQLLVIPAHLDEHRLRLRRRR